MLNKKFGFLLYFFVLMILSSFAVDYYDMVIGYSVDNRPIKLFACGRGREFLVMIAGIHGNEGNTTETAYHLIDQIKSEKIIIPPSKTVIIVPNANPDGLAYQTRVNAHQVDLNRNFETTNWQKTSLYHGRILSCGAYPFSEPESQVIQNLFLEINRLPVTSVALTLHSQANAIFEASEDSYNIILAEYLRQISKFKRIIYYPTTGDLERWLAEEYGIASATIEFATKKDPENQELVKVVQILLKTDFTKKFYQSPSKSDQPKSLTSQHFNSLIKNLKISK
ncbi:MAG: DUF2817 domain-containing protein [Spirochaetes bacterium]|nr:DUF2817 domain-containing protein [Spirochaetota bacterium]